MGIDNLEAGELLMFLPQVSEFVEYLSTKEHSLDEILAHMVLRTLAPIEATSAFVSELNRENRVSSVGNFGIAQETGDRYQVTYDLRDSFPITDAIRNRRIVWINTLPTWPEEYPALKDLEYETGDRTFICFPIEKCGTPIAVLGIFSKSVIHPDAEIDSFLKAIGNILSLHVYRKTDSALENRNSTQKRTIELRGEVNTTLTERQRLILRMMSEGRTNIKIGELLGYSESTIRQETIKIFAMLNCDGREEASQIYLKKYGQSSTANA